MDVVGFLDALCWGNSLAIADPTDRAARMSLTHNDRIAIVVSRWLNPPRTSQGGARNVLLPLMVRTVKEIVSKEMEAVVAPVFYDIIRTAAWGERQEEQKSHRDPTKVSSYLNSALLSRSNEPLHSASRLSSVRMICPAEVLDVLQSVTVRVTGHTCLWYELGY